MSGSTGIWLGDPNAAQAVQARGLDAVQATTGEVLGAAAGSAWHESIGPRALDWAGRQFGEDSPMLDAEEATRRFGIPGTLKFDRPVSEATAGALRQGREAEQARQSIIARRGDGLATSAVGRTALSFGVAMLDPVNVGLALIPFVGEARMAALLGTTSRTALRAAAGAANGALGMAALEPADYALSRAEFNDRTMAQTLGNIAFGGVLGGGLHVLGGAAMDAVRGRRASPVEAAIGAAPDPVRNGMLQGAVAAVAEGRPVEVAPLMNLPTATSYRAVAGEAADGAYAAFTPGGLRVEARPEVVDLGSLIPSHMADGSVNPLYPHAEGLQPRDRSTAGSQDQIHAIAANLQPERLGPSPEAGAGAPIVDGRGVVESGNGRVAALERVYSSPDLAHRAQAYRAYLESQGHDLTGIAQPVLVGRRVTDLSADEARSFARGANERPNLSLSAAEQARADADRAGRVITELQPGQLSASQNRDFTRAFLAQLPAEERGSLVLADGRLSAAGEARIRAGMLAHAYGDAMGPLLERLLNGEVDNLKTIAGALADSAGPWGRMRAAAARGEIPPDLDITAGLGEAVQLIERARREGKTVPEILAQRDAFAAAPGPATLALLRLMHRDEALTRPLSREALDELLARYTTEAMKVAPGPDLFGAAPAGPADLLRAAARHTDPEAATARALDDLANAPRASAEDVQASREVARMAQEPPPRQAPPEPAPKPEPASATSGEVVDSTNLWRLSRDELEMMLEDVAASDSEKLVRALGEQGAREFKQLQAQSNSIDPRRAEAAYPKLDAIEARMDARQRALVFGEGETNATAEDIKAMLKAHDALELDANGNGPSNTDIAWEASLGLRRMDSEEILRVPQHGGTVEAQVAYVRLMRGYQELRARGVPADQIPGELARGMAEVSGMSLSDAADFVGDLVRAMQGGQERPAGTAAAPAQRQIAAPQKALPRPVDPETARVTADADAAIAQLEALPLSAEERAQVDALRSSVQAAEGDARAHEAAAMCMAGVR